MEAINHIKTYYENYDGLIDIDEKGNDYFYYANKYHINLSKYYEMFIKNNCQLWTKHCDDFNKTYFINPFLFSYLNDIFYCRSNELFKPYKHFYQYLLSISLDIDLFSYYEIVEMYVFINRLIKSGFNFKTYKLKDTRNKQYQKLIECSLLDNGYSIEDMKYFI